MILESERGDLLLSDPKFKIDTMIMKEFIDKSKKDQGKLIVIASQIINFLNKQAEARWLQVEIDFKEIRKEDRVYASYLKGRFGNFANCLRSIENLRSIEKEIFVWKTKKLT